MVTKLQTSNSLDYTPCAAHRIERGRSGRWDADPISLQDKKCLSDLSRVVGDEWFVQWSGTCDIHSLRAESNAVTIFCTFGVSGGDEEKDR